MYQSQWAPSRDEEEKVASSSLSASATPFSPSAPPPDVSSNDYFAQTGAIQDALFDGLTPIDNSMRVRSEDDLFSEDFTPVKQPVVERQQGPQRGSGRADVARGRGRGGRARGAQQTRGDAAATVAPRAAPAAIPTATTTEDTAAQEPRPSEAPEEAPKGPRKEGVPSVRGNRQATGGVVKPKLTEEELAEKMARIQLKNASLAAAHARAEADAASFAEREAQAKQVAAQKQREERRDRQQMMGERERNRMRKLKAMEGREWDAEKNEDDFQKGGRFDKKGGFAGDREEYTDGREYLYKEGRGASRGFRGGGRGRSGPPREQRPPRQEEFPALPATKTADDPPIQTMDPASREAVRSWADQVESSQS